MTVLLDTSFLLAAAMKQDKNHDLAATAMRSIAEQQFIAAPVVVELFFVMAARLTYIHAVKAVSALSQPVFKIIALTESDRQRMQQIMLQYRDAELDFADTAQVAIAERLGINKIYTFDRRDFSIIRPKHRAYFDLYP